MLKCARRLQQGAAPVQLPVSALHLLWNLAVALTVCSNHETSNGEKNVEDIAIPLIAWNQYLSHFMVSPIAEVWRLLTEAQNVVGTCCTRFTNSNEASGDQKASWESKAAIQDKNNICQKISGSIYIRTPTSRLEIKFFQLAFPNHIRLQIQVLKLG